MRILLSAGCWLVLLASFTTGKLPDDEKKPDTGHVVDLDGVKIEFVRVGKGKFWMGSPKDEKGRDSDDQEQKVVTIDEDFYIGKYEVTQQQWEAVMGKNPSDFSRTGDGKDTVKDVTEKELRQFPGK